MSEGTIELFRKVKGVVGGQEGWFAALRDWYRHPEWSRQVLEDVRGSSNGKCRLTLAVNGTLVEPGYDHVDARFHRVSWAAPATALRAGDNTLTVGLAAGSETPLLLNELAVGATGAAWQTVTLTAAEARGTPTLFLASCRRAAYRQENGCWALEAEGGLAQFSLRLARPAGLAVTLNLATAPESPWRQLLLELFKEAREAVLEKLQDLEEAAERRSAEGDPRAQQLWDAWRTLRAYARLQQEQIEPALRGGPDGTLSAIIQATGDPEALVREALRTAARSLAPVQVRPPATLAVVEPAPVWPAGPDSSIVVVDEDIPTRPPGNPPGRQNPPTRGAGPRTAAAPTAGAGWVVGLIVIGVLGYLAYANDWLGKAREFLDKAGSANGNGANLTGEQRRQDDEVSALLRQQKASTGEVQVSLWWNNKNDLDLHVVAPSGVEIFFGRPQSPCGGKLDVDMNRGGMNLKAPAVENVFWGKAPKGTYKVYVTHFTRQHLPGCEDPTRYVVRVQAGGRTQIFQGQVAFNPARPKVFVTEFTVN